MYVLKWRRGESERERKELEYHSECIQIIFSFSKSRSTQISTNCMHWTLLTSQMTVADGVNHDIYHQCSTEVSALLCKTSLMSNDSKVYQLPVTALLLNWLEGYLLL